VPIQVVSRPQRVSLTRQCLESIQEYIAANELHAGDKLPSQQEWAELLGVSVLVVREAFQALQALGLVEIQHGRGIFVRGPEEADFLNLLAVGRSLSAFPVEEVVEARAMLELAVLETCIARASEESISEMDRSLQRLRESPFRAGMFSAEHKRFHQAMLRASGDRLLAHIGRPLLNTFWTLGDAGHLHLTREATETDMIEVHAAYLEAIRKRDFSHTRELVDRHLLGLCSKYHVFPRAGTLEDQTKS
jgi:GntR family transcriptional repressor for pyruvate dehydrogenase complex